jgi:hypothetical protein
MNGKPTFGLEDKYYNDEYNSTVQAEMQKKGRPLSNSEKAVIVISSPNDRRLGSFESDIVASLEHGGPSEAKDAAMAYRMVRDRGFRNVLKEISYKDELLASDILLQMNDSNRNSNHEAQILARLRRDDLKDITPEEEKIYRGRYNIYIKSLSNNSSDLVDLRPKDWKDKLLSEVAIDPDQRMRFEIDARRELKKAFRHGVDSGEKAKKIAYGQMSKYWGLSKLNAAGAAGILNKKAYLEKEPPELKYPEYADTHFLMNQFFAVAEIFVKSDKTGNIRLKEALVKKPDSPEDEINKDLTIGKIPIVQVKIGNKWEDRQLWQERDFDTEDAYNIYYFLDEVNRSSKVYLKNSRSPFKARFSFNPPKIPEK